MIAKLRANQLPIVVFCGVLLGMSALNGWPSKHVWQIVTADLGLTILLALAVLLILFPSGNKIGRVLVFLLLLATAILNIRTPLTSWTNGNWDVRQPLQDNSLWELAARGGAHRDFYSFFGATTLICGWYPSNPIYRHGADARLHLRIEGRPGVDFSTDTLGCHHIPEDRYRVPVLDDEIVASLMTAYPYTEAPDHNEHLLYIVFNVPAQADTPVWILPRGDRAYVMPESVLPTDMAYIDLPLYTGNVILVYRLSDGALHIYRNQDGSGVFLTRIEPWTLSQEDYIYTTDDGWVTQLDVFDGNHYRLIVLSPDGNVVDSAFTFQAEP